MPVFSIIVPIYNAEKTLGRCLDSLRVQKYQDFEVLMIENGSVDSSNAICKEYAEKDSRFNLYSCKENKGPSGARNIGLNSARGTYITFLDSDDYIDPEYLEVLLAAFRNSDVVFFGYHQISMDGAFLGDHIPQISGDMDYYEILIKLYEQDLFGYTWIKAFRRDAIGNHRFSHQLNLMEDEVFTCEVLTNPKQIKVISETILNYVTGNKGSLVGRSHQDYCYKVDMAYNAWKKLLQPYEKRDKVLAQMANAHVRRCMYYGFERDVDFKKFINELSTSNFFIDSTLNNEFTVCVKYQNIRKLSKMRTWYRTKMIIAKLLRR